MQFRWCHVENPFEKNLQSRSFSRGIFIALGSMCLERNAFLPELNSGKRRDYYRSALTAKQTASQWLHVPSAGHGPLAGFTASDAI